MIYGGNGHYGGGGDPSVPCDYMFPGDSDPTGIGTGGVPQPIWTEALVGNVPFDRRFLLSSGPFTFAPGDVRSLHQAVVWARDTVVEVSDYSTQIGALQTADDYVQTAFDAKFQNLACCPPTRARDRPLAARSARHWVSTSSHFGFCLCSRVFCCLDDGGSFRLCVLEAGSGLNCSCIWTTRQ